MKDNDINIVRGDSLVFGVEFSKLNVEISNLTFTVRALPTDESPLFQKKIGSGISLIASSTAEDGTLNRIYSVRIAPEDTKDLDYGTYYYDLEFRQSNPVFTDVYTLLRGKFEVEYEVTHYSEA